MRSGPLRNYLDPEMQKLRYADTKEAHKLGSILVYAVYEAFRNIVGRRTADLVRLATGGTGVLPAGAIHPDLVERLTREICKAAQHVLHMCIRALDYCPAVDITFGEYLRALITADADLYKDDGQGYRVAFMEAFRNRGILPQDVRTISEESLTWNTVEDRSPPWLKGVLCALDVKWNRDPDRSKLYELAEGNRRAMHTALTKVFKQHPQLLAQFGLLPDIPKYTKDGSIKDPKPKGETTFDVFSVRGSRRMRPDGSFQTDIIAVILQRRPVLLDPADPGKGWFWFRGGATLICDATYERESIRYVIVKESSSNTRVERQRQTMTGVLASPLQGLYFGGVAQNSALGGEPFAALHASYREPENG